jgi:hypothetical protein
MEQKRVDIEMRWKTLDERVACVARTRFARARLLPRAIARVPSRVKAQEIPSIESVSGARPQITCACYCLLSFREVHDLAGDSGR